MEAMWKQNRALIVATLGRELLHARGAADAAASGSVLRSPSLCEAWKQAVVVGLEN